MAASHSPCLTSDACGSVLMKLASANYNGLVSSITNPLVVFFWIALPSVNKWAGGASYTTEVIACDFAAVPVMMLGIWMFRRFEEDKMTRRSRSLTQRSRSKDADVTQALLAFQEVDYSPRGKTKPAQLGVEQHV